MYGVKNVGTKKPKGKSKFPLRCSFFVMIQRILQFLAHFFILLHVLSCVLKLYDPCHYSSDRLPFCHFISSKIYHYMSLLSLLNYFFVSRPRC